MIEHEQQKNNELRDQLAKSQKEINDLISMCIDNILEQLNEINENKASFIYSMNKSKAISQKRKKQSSKLKHKGVKGDDSYTDKSVSSNMYEKKDYTLNGVTSSFVKIFGNEGSLLG